VRGRGSRVGFALLLLVLLCYIMIASETVTASFRVTVTQVPAASLTALQATGWAVRGIDPMHTPRPLAIDVTATPAVTATAISCVHPFSVACRQSPHFLVYNGSVRSGSLWTEEVCVALSPFDYVKIEDYGRISDPALWLVTRIIVDNEMIFTDTDFSVVWINDAFVPVGNELGTPVGGVGGEVDICFSTNDLSIGDHTATIEVRPREGEVYSYTWSFHIDAYSTPTPTSTP
jgi:hypothetical protein